MSRPLGLMLQSIWMNVLDLLLSLILATAKFEYFCADVIFPNFIHILLSIVGHDEIRTRFHVLAVMGWVKCCATQKLCCSGLTG